MFFCNKCLTRQPAWQCENAHFICESCHSFFTFCSTCHTENVQSRSLIAQKIVGLFSKPCQFTKHGCKDFIKELDHHERDCSYREIACFFEDCPDKILMYKVLEHYQIFGQWHQNFTIPIEEVCNEDRGFFNLAEGFDIRVSISHQNELYQKASYLKLKEDCQFFFLCWAGNLKRKAIFWMYYLGSPKEAEKFVFRLRLFNQGSEKEIHVTGPTIGIDTKYHRMSFNPLSFKFPFSEIKQFWSQNEIKLSWEVTVVENNFPNMIN